MKYILITAARNEDAFIEKALISVTKQTHLPEWWVIVDDGSSDRTAEIAEGYASTFSWIEVVRNGPRRDRSFAGKAHAVNSSFERALGRFSFEVIGNLDADVSFDENYMQFLLEKFSEDTQLGVAGTPFTQDGDYDSARDSFEGESYVAGPCQLFRRECFEDIGGYVPNKAGGVDWIAVVAARMKGWKAKSFPEKRFHHYRKMGTAGKSMLRAAFEYGERAYYLGGSPIWHLFRCLYRIPERPLLLGSVALMGGYVSAGLRRVKRPVSYEMMRFHRAEQMNRLGTILKTVLRFRKVDSFRVATADERSGS